MKYVIVGTAGHIDHGKSALVRALTGIDPDRLEEEKRRGITIDLGFAHLDLGDGLKLGFIDVPGHERFVKNMLAGVGGIDVVLLVVAADESIKPQTREHFDICKLLGIPRGIVVITKSDLVEREILDLVRLEAQDFVAGSFLEAAPVVAVSARTGAGLEALKAELRGLSLQIAARPTDSLFRLPVDRAFVMKGFGSVVTGTLIAGRIEKEAEVEILPLGRRARVRGIEVHNAPAEVALAGQRTALNLAGVEAKELARGMVLVAPGLLGITHRLDCALTVLPAARPLRNRARVHFHCWSAEILAEVILLESKELRGGERGYAQLLLSKPGQFLPGDRFIIRQFSPVTTIGGGVIVDNQPPKHRFRDPEVHQFLETMRDGDSEARLLHLTRQSGEFPCSALPGRTGWQTWEAVRHARALEEKGLLMILGQPPTLLVTREYFASVSQRVVDQLERFHQANPLVAGLSKEELRGRIGVSDGTGGPLPSPTLFNAVLQFLTTEGRVAAKGELVQQAGRGIAMSPEEATAREQISAAFGKAGLAVPTVSEVLAALRIDRARAEKILHLLLREGTLVKVAEDMIFHKVALDELRKLVAQHKARSNRINVPVFKELTGLSRKYAIPLLEYLDRERVTRREGDGRIIL